MFAVIMTGGKQYRVSPGTTVEIEKIDGKDGATVTFDQVLLVGDGKGVHIGTPTVPGASVAATVQVQGRSPKVAVVKYHSKTRYRRNVGHRQAFTKVAIT
ncbi:MAG: 50S ribosomal protein L21, partial [Candidatus Kerfeldbacteria bacterium]|nr:50S ribosomal protein L21 [Candidatus Kerfeldbacteria bacterium]